MIYVLVKLAGAYRGAGEYQRALGPARECAELAGRLAEGNAQREPLRATAEEVLRQALRDADQAPAD